MYLHSDLDLKDTYVICEIVVSVHDKSKENRVVNHLSLGLLTAKVTDESGK